MADTDTVNTITGTGGPVAPSWSATYAETVLTLTGSGGPVEPTQSIGAYTASVDTIAGAAIAIAPTDRSGTASTTAALTASIWDDDNAALLATPTTPIERRFQDPLSDVGSGRLTVLATDSAASAIQPGNHVRFAVNGVDAFTIRISKRENHLIDQAEEAAETVAGEGPGLIAALDEQLVYPHGGAGALPVADSRPFSWASPETSTAGWPAAVVQYDRISRQINLDPPYHEPWLPPKGWPAPLTVDWIWSRSRASDLGSQHPAGRCYFRKTITVATDQTVMFFVAADDRCRVMLDGKTIIDWTSSYPEDSFLDCTRAGVPVTAGSHVVGVEAETYGGDPVRPRRGMVALAVHALPTAGVPFSASTLIAGTDATWVCLDYPSVVPAPSPGTIVATLLSEASARGGDAWATSFSGSVDSAGRPWDQPYEFVCRVGDSVLDVLKALADVSVDFHADPVGRTLHMWNRGTARAASSGAAYAEGVDLTSLVHQLEV